MKLVRFDGGKTGLMVELPSGPHVLDVIGSLGALAPDDPISQGVLNGMLKDNGKWSALIEHWPLARVGLRRLGLLALADPKAERLVIRRADVPDRRMERFQGKRILVEATDRQPRQLDGDLIADGLGMDIQVEAAAVAIRVQR